MNLDRLRKNKWIRGVGVISLIIFEIYLIIFLSEHWNRDDGLYLTIIGVFVTGLVVNLILCFCVALIYELYQWVVKYEN